MFDHYQRWHPRPYQAVPVRVVDVDEESLKRVGQWPWRRTRIAEMMEKLQQVGAAAIGFDVMFAEPDRTSPTAMLALWDVPGELRRPLGELPDHDEVMAEVSAALCTT